MTKSEIITKIVTGSEHSRVEVERIVNAFLDGVATALAADDRVNISGFGTFKVAKLPARTGRNPATGASIQIAASAKAKFTQGKELKDKLSGK
jgi:DNA-binding protein HU-beta